jgi:dTDP-4-dehydrorhamnose 3,5-epimerase
MRLEPFQTESPVFEDNRGCFAPIKLYGDWTQSNISISDNIFTFRGLHLQNGDHKQTKKLSVIRGAIIDFVVDLRPETFGNVFQFMLEQGQAVFIPNYFAHGFLTLKSGTIVNYVVDNDYNKESEVCIKWDSVPDVKEAITKYMAGWDLQLVISSKDEEGITLEEYREKFVNLV